MNAIDVHRLKKVFGQTVALQDVSLVVRKKDIYGFLGPNGSGKTTTLRIFLGILQQDEGTVAVLGMSAGT